MRLAGRRPLSIASVVIAGPTSGYSLAPGGALPFVALQRATVSFPDIGIGPVAPIDDRYDEFLGGVREVFRTSVAAGTALFAVDTAGLFEVFLGALTPELAAANKCGTCRAFVDRYGGLVLVDSAGKTTSVLWSAAISSICSARPA